MGLSGGCGLVMGGGTSCVNSGGSISVVSVDTELKDGGSLI